MLLYVTAEDVLGEAGPEPRGPEPDPGVPATLAALYDRGMRHHRRGAAFHWIEGGERLSVPDWRLDRLVIRVALYSRERLGLLPGARAAIFGPLGRLWPAAEFAIQGLGAAAVGIEHDVPDEALGAALRDAEPRIVFSTDAASTRRLLGLGAKGLPLPPVVAEAAEPGVPPTTVLPIDTLLKLGGTLDTPERAQDFRTVGRGVAPGVEALWHVGGRGVERLSHGRAMEHVTSRWRSRPALSGDVVLVVPARVTLAGRLALAALVGEGRAATVLADGLATDLPALRPHAICAPSDWLDSACRGCAPRWPLGLDRIRARRRLGAVLGNRLRWVETDRAPDASTVAALAAAGARLFVDGDAVEEGEGLFP